MAEISFDNNLEELKRMIPDSNLPKNLNETLLKNYLLSTDGDVGEAIKMLKVAFELRAKNPNLFADRSTAVKELKGVCETIPLPRKGLESPEYSISRLLDPDSEKLEYDRIMKAYWVLSDYRLISADNSKLGARFVDIIDMKGSSLRHVFKIKLQSAKMQIKYYMHAQPLKIERVHVINCSSFVKAATKLLRPITPQQILDLFEFHAENEDTLFDFVPKDCLPVEYGGTCESLEIVKEKFWKKLEKDEVAKYLYNDSNWRLDEEESGS